LKASASSRGGTAGIRPLQREQAGVEAPLGGRLRVVGGQRLLAGALPVEHRADAAARGDPERERRADPLAAERQAVARGVAREEHAVLGRGAQAVREPVALIAHGLGLEALAISFVPSLTC
jgi:hypothetical protein